MKFKVKIDRQTKSGKIVYDFVEALQDKEGIEYTDFNEDNYLTEEEFFEELEKVIIKYINERQRNRQQIKLNKILKVISIKRKRNRFTYN